jgi:L-asparaginase II
MIHTLAGLGALDESQRNTLADRLRPAQTNWAGTEVGELRPTAALAF